MGMRREGANFLHPDHTVLKDNSAFYCQMKLGKLPCAELLEFVRQSFIKMKMQQYHNLKMMQSR